MPQGDGGDEGTLPGDMGGVNLAPVARLVGSQLASSVPVVKSRADYDSLPKGALYVDKDGKKWRKP